MSLEPILNPVNGRSVELAPGVRQEIQFEFENQLELPLELHIVTEGDAEEWCSILPNPIHAAPFESVLVRVVIAVPANAGGTESTLTIYGVDQRGSPIKDFIRTGLRLLVREAEAQIPPSPPITWQETPEGEGSDEGETYNEVPPVEPPRNPDYYVNEPSPLGHSKEVDPPDRKMVTVLAGDKLYVRFDLRNGEPLERRYRLINRSSSTTAAWYRDKRNENFIPTGQRGFLSCTVLVPDNAPAGTYEVALEIGHDGAEPEIRRLRIKVAERPSVGIEARGSSVVLHPFQKALAKFGLSVSATGNSATAYRLSIRNPQPKKDTNGRVVDSGDLYDFGPWTVHFDSELDNVRPASDLTEIRRDHVLQARRRSIWWLGWVEKRNFDVRVVPVTDVDNHNRAGNFASMSLLRWRVLPFPWFVSVILGFFLWMLLSGGEIGVSNGIAVVGPDANTYYVVPSVAGRAVPINKPDGVPVVIDVRKPLFGIAQIERQVGTSRDSVESEHSVSLENGEYSKEVSYSARSPFRAGKISSVYIVGARTQNSLQLDGNLKPVAERFDLGIFGAGFAKHASNSKVSTWIAPEPSNGSYSIRLRNTAKQNKISIFPVLVEGVSIEGVSAKGQEVNPDGGTISLKIKAGKATQGEKQAVFVTTDVDNQIVRIRFVAENEFGAGLKPSPKNPPDRQTVAIARLRTMGSRSALWQCVKGAVKQKFNLTDARLKPDGAKNESDGWLPTVWKNYAFFVADVIDGDGVNTTDSLYSDPVLGTVVGLARKLDDGRFERVELIFCDSEDEIDEAVLRVKGAHPDLPEEMFR